MLIDLTPDPVLRAVSHLHAQQSDSKKKTTLDDLVDAGAAHPGWAVSAANGPCVEAWRDRLHALGRSAAEASDAVARTVHDVVGTHQSIADAMSADAQWLKGA